MDRQLAVPNVGRRTVWALVRPFPGMRRHFVPLPVGEVREGPLAKPTPVRFDPGMNARVRLQLFLGGQHLRTVRTSEGFLASVNRAAMSLEDPPVSEGSTALVADFCPGFGMRFLVGFQPLRRSEHFLTFVTGIFMDFPQVDYVFVLPVATPAVEHLATESTNVLLGEAIESVPH